jgi:hypothetical protein
MTSPTPATVGPRPLEPPAVVAAMVFGVELPRPDGFVVDWQLVAGDGAGPVPCGGIL